MNEFLIQIPLAIDATTNDWRFRRGTFEEKFGYCVVRRPQYFRVKFAMQKPANKSNSYNVRS